MIVFNMYNLFFEKIKIIEVKIQCLLVNYAFVKQMKIFEEEKTSH